MIPISLAELTRLKGLIPAFDPSADVTFDLNTIAYIRASVIRSTHVEVAMIIGSKDILTEKILLLFDPINNIELVQAGLLGSILAMHVIVDSTWHANTMMIMAYNNRSSDVIAKSVYLVE